MDIANCNVSPLQEISDKCYFKGLDVMNDVEKKWKMNELIKYTEITTEQGFTFQKGWWGEFSSTGELVKVYAYPFVNIDNRNWAYSWRFARIFYPFDGGYVGDLELLENMPDKVVGDFVKVAEQEMFAQREYLEKEYING